MKQNEGKIWSRSELSNQLRSVMNDNECNESLPKLWFQNLTSALGDSILVLKSPGLSDIVMYRSHASKFLRLDPCQDDEVDIQTSAKVIVKETKSIKQDRNRYLTTIDADIAQKYASKTLLDLLSALHPKLDRSLPALLIGNIITSIINNSYTQLQLALGLYMNSARKVKVLHDFHVSCSYDEVSRFKTSAAMYVQRNPSKQLSSQNGLVQIVSDNFDLKLATQNCLQQTHSLAIIATSSNTSSQQKLDNSITRLKKTELTGVQYQQNHIDFYQGPKKNFSQPSVLPRAVVRRLLY